MIGAGVGALSSLATGGNPLQGAIIGGATGGLGDKLMGAEGLSSLFDVGSGAATGVNSLGSGAGLMGGTGTGSGVLGSVGGSGLTSSVVQNPEFVSPLLTNSAGMPTAALDVANIPSSLISEAGGYVPSATEAQTAANLQQFGSLTGAPADTRNILERGTDFVSNQYDKASPMDIAGLGLQGLQATQTPPTPPLSTPAPQVVQGKQPTIGSPLAINPPRPATTYALGPSEQDIRQRLLYGNY